MVWIIKVTRPEPKAEIVKDLRYTAIVINGNPVEPGRTYEVTKGDTISYYGFAKNIGGDGYLWIGLAEEGAESTPIVYNAGYVKAGDFLDLPEGSLRVDRDMRLKFVAGHGRTAPPFYDRDDEWGC